MSLTLNCFILGDIDSNQVFPVKIPTYENIGILKKLIKEEQSPRLTNIDAAELILSHVSLPFNTFTPQLTVETYRKLSPWEKISSVFDEDLVDDHLHILVQTPTATITPSSSQDSLHSPPPWLVDIHEKLWGKHEKFGEIFRTAKLTEEDFNELQSRLEKLNPERKNSELYVAKDVLATKSAYLRSRSEALSDKNVDMRLLVPRLVFNPPSSYLVEDGANDTDDGDDADDTDDDTMDIDSDPGSTGCSNVNTDSSNGIFPCTIQYMDLTGLELKYGIRVPLLTLLRNEWGDMIDIFNNRTKGVRGSVIFTGQPGIGKTSLLYCILILCIIHARPVVFQDMRGEVFIIDTAVRHQQRRSRPIVSGEDVLTLVDADGVACQPDPYLFDSSNLRILLTSSPRSRKDRKWLTQSVEDETAVYVMKLWSREELLIASLFLASIDITLERFHQTCHICGYSPHRFFRAAVSPNDLSNAKDVIALAIKDTKELSDSLTDVHNGVTVHRAFHIRPSPLSRLWDSCLAEPVSVWALEHMMTDLDRRSREYAYTFYCAIKGDSRTSTLVGMMFETKVHQFLGNIKNCRSFTIQSLDDRSYTLDIKFSSDTKHLTFGADQDFSGQLTSSVGSNKQSYLKPNSSTYPSFDSFLYKPSIPESGFSPLIALQVTTAATHDINIKGLEKIQKSLKPAVAALKNLRPTKARKMIILFVVPDTMGPAFVQQKITGANKMGHWYDKTAQYVLMLSEEELFRAM